MPHLPPSVALASCEGALRQLLDQVLTKKHGADWLQKVYTSEKIRELERRREVEAKRRGTRGVTTVSAALIDFTHFYDLKELAKSNWNLVAPALGKQVTGALLDRFDDLRDTVAHSRDLLPFEEDLLAGIAGEIRNRVTLFMSSQDEGGDYFARIEEIVDNFGNRIDGAQTLQTSNPGIVTDQALGVGEVLTWRCRGWDPQGRALRWHVLFAPSKDWTFVEVEGNEVELSYTVREDNISMRSYAVVRLIADSPYHRWSEGVDGMALFYYRVNPSA